MAPSKRKISAVIVALLLDDEQQTGQKHIRVWQDDEQKTCKKRRDWVKPLLKKRENVTLNITLKENNPDDYRDYLRITDDAFKELSSLVSLHVVKKETEMKKSVSAEERLIATLKFLTTGRSLEDLTFSTGIPAQALGQIIPETCQAIIDSLGNEFMKFPSTADEWKKVAEDFDLLWNFPNCGGAVNGKHMPIVPPPKTKSHYLNHSGYYSLILMAVVNANLEFMMVEVDRKGGALEEGGIHDTPLHEMLIGNTLDLPESSETKNGLNFVFIGSEAYGIQEHFLAPLPQEDLSYEEKIYNYRLLRARQVVDNTFGVIASVFRVFQSPVALKPETVSRAALASCVLHNFLLRNCKESYIPHGVTDIEDLESGVVFKGSWRDDINDECFVDLQLQGDQICTDEANNARLSYIEYFSGDGKVPWQDKMIIQKDSSSINDSGPSSVYPSE